MISVGPGLEGLEALPMDVVNKPLKEASLHRVVD